MRYLEVRRHSIRAKKGEHLSQSGVNLAREVGREIGPFNLVITSTQPRAVETAVAMGLGVSETFDELNPIADTSMLQSGFKALARMATQSDSLGGLAQIQQRLWTTVVKAVPDGSSALIITHGGVIELGTIGCVPSIDWDSLGGACGYCEGVRLAFDNEQFVSAGILRVKRDK